jgi:polyisoprenoid-binding protein YceI
MPASSLLTSLALSITLVFASAAARADSQKCTYTLDPSSVAVGWTAYKTSQKTGVNGSFKKVEVTGKTEGDSLGKLADGLQVSADKLSVDTGNPARDKTLSDYFFAKLTPSISGKIRKFSEKSKTFVLVLDFNGKKKDIQMHFETKEDKFFEASGTMDVLAFGAKDALDSLHEQCKDLHKGADGVSKTWSEVALHLKAAFAKSCQ